MGRRILERDRELGELAAAARAAASGEGCVVLVYGEAGIGKSSMVEAMRGRIPAEGRMLVGHCDDLAAARILGPFRDLIGSVSADLTRALRDGDDRDRILTALRTELDWTGHPTVLAIEDVHWADDASLDVLRYLVRRVHELPLVLMLTYRDDELSRDHPLHQLLALAVNARRMPLQRLSPDAVRRLSEGTAVDADEVYAVTSGNPFFVCEVLTDGTGVTPTVVDAMLARLSRLDPATREAVEQLSVVPTAIDRRLVDALVPGGLPALAEAEERGLLVASPDRVTFRHELTRRAIADALPAVRRAVLNAQVLARLVEQPGVDVARLVHHAAEAGDRDAIVRYGPQAARTAAGGGAHREALAHYRLVLEQRDGFGPPEQAALLEGYAVECYILGEGDLSVAAQDQALELYRELGDDAALGAGLRWMSRMQWWNGNRPAAEQNAKEAVAVLERVGDPRLLAIAYSNRSQLHMLAFRNADAIPLAERAVDLARQTGDDATLAHALNNLGCAVWRSGDERGRELLEESLRVALDAGEIDHACRAYVNMAWELIDRFRIEEAEPYLRAGADLAERDEHLGFLAYMHVGRARIELGRGHWDEAVKWATAGMEGRSVYAAPALGVIGRAKARRGDADAEAVLATAVELGTGLREVQWTAPAAAAAAECAWLRGDADEAARLAGDMYAEVSALTTPAFRSELVYWLAKAGRSHPDGVHGPYGLLAAGRWREAAELWRDCPYEHALALSESPDAADLLAALTALEALEAAPLARIVRRRLRELGVTAPRGPAPATRSNPAGLTARQLEVLRLLAEGLSNAEIADRLVLSVRTAANHVAAVLDKLGVHTRAEAVEAGAEFLSTPGEN
jgi:DNA-binding CsgD family transcriptional regulator/tetratricopeptide (TPR) repeat protein